MMKLMLILGCVEYHVLIYEMCEIDPSKFGRGYEMQDYRKSTKIDYGWRTFAQSQNLEAET